MPVDKHACMEHRQNVRFRQNFFRCAQCNNRRSRRLVLEGSSFLSIGRFSGRARIRMLRGKQHDPLAEGGSEIEVVGYGKNGQTLLMFAPKDLEDIDLMSNIQMCVFFL